MQEKAPLLLTIAILGGTGKQGKGLAYRWARAGYKVLIGSRTPEKAVTTASELIELLEGSGSLVGISNHEAAQLADIVVLTVPYAAHAETLENVKDALKGKMLIDVTVPLGKPKNKVQPLAGGSATLEARAILGDEVQVVAAFQNISPEYFLTDEEVDCEVLVTGSGREARLEAIKLVEAAGFTGWDAGPIENSVVIEGLTSVLININKQYGSTHAGIRITGVEKK